MAKLDIGTLYVDAHGRRARPISINGAQTGRMRELPDGWWSARVVLPAGSTLQVDGPSEETCTRNLRLAVAGLAT